MVGVALLSGAVWFAFFTMQERQVSATMAVQQQEDERRSVYTASVRALLRDTEEERAALSAITQERDLVESVQYLEDTAKRAGVDISVDAVSAAGSHADDSTLEGYVVSMRVSGSFAAIMHFANLIEHSQQPTILEQAVFEHTNEGWEAILRPRIYIDGQKDTVNETSVSTK